MMTTGTQATGAAGATGYTRALWTDHDAEIVNPPEQAFADVFGDADRVRIALWIDRTAPAHGGLFCTDTCASDLDLTETTVRAALGPLQQVGMVRYQGGLYLRRDHTLWSVLKVLRNFAGPTLRYERHVATSPASEPSDVRAATFYFG